MSDPRDLPTCFFKRDFKLIKYRDHVCNDCTQSQCRTFGDEKPQTGTGLEYNIKT